MPERQAAFRNRTLNDGGAISLAEFSRGGGHLNKLQSLASPRKQEHGQFTRYSLPLASSEAVAPLQLLLPLNQQYPSLRDFEVVKTIGESSILSSPLIMAAFKK